jgi:hypothetical protein
MSRFAAARDIPVIGRWIGRLHYASAIRVQELVGIMDMLAGSTPSPAHLSAATTDAERMAYIVASARRRFQPGPEAIVGAQAGAPLGGSSIAAAEARQIGVAMHDVTTQVALAKEDLESWFIVIMDRVSERFAVHMRIWTIVFSLIVAFALHLDSFRLLSQLAANSEARARLVGASDAVQRAAIGTFAPQQLPSIGAPAASSAAAAEPGSAQSRDDRFPAPPVLYQAVMKNALETEPALAGVDVQSLPGFFSDRVTASNWLRATLAGLGQSPSEIETAIARYAVAVDEALTGNQSAHEADVRRLSDQALTMRGILEGAGFQLVPNPYHSWDVSPWWPRPVGTGRPSNLHFWGILFSAGLLSLGAPFWYNALKGLSALKPIVANKEQQERQGQR